MQTEEVPNRYLGNGVPSKITTLRTQENWNNWKWQIENRITSSDDLSSTFGEHVGGEVSVAASKFPMAITPYYASLIRSFDQSDPVYRMSVPAAGELFDPPVLSDDPLHEDEESPLEGLVHKYRNRALLISTSICSMYCRYCTRKRVTGQSEHSCSKANLDNWVGYLRQHPEITDVIVSGGDPFTMATPKLDGILTAIRSVETVEVIRIGTRTPVVLPMRMDLELVDMLKKHHPIWVNTHFNHPNEVTPESAKALAMLADAGIPLGNQSVLLKGVNDDPLVMESLCRKLIKMRVRPYYIFLVDKVRGTNHFQTKVDVGLDIMRHLHKSIGGIGIPTLVVDLPEGGGKVRMSPNYVVGRNDDQILFQSQFGKVVNYHDGD